MAASNRKQTEIPANAEMLDNRVGTACGFALRLNRCWIFFTPGVPSEFKVMVEQQILPRLKQQFELQEPQLCLRLTTFGRVESDITAELEPLALPWAIARQCRLLISSSPDRPASAWRWSRPGNRCACCWRSALSGDAAKGGGDDGDEYAAPLAARQRSQHRPRLD